MIPKRGFAKTYAFLAANYGSVDMTFRDGDELVQAPAGVAHYLEHKMFDLPEGNAMQQFAATGASPNAFTGYSMTAYYFECTDAFEQNLQLLLRMVDTPYFTEQSVEKERGKNFRFTITTNGMLLDDEKIDYINKEMSNCVLSLDGRKEVNDNIRPTPNGKGSYDIIVPKYQKLVAGRGTKDYYVRGTFTKYNLDFANDVLHISDLGFEQLSVEPVVTDPEMPYAITESDLPTIFAEYDRLEKLMEEQKLANNRKFNFFHFMIDLNQGPCAVKRLRGCGCGNEYVAVTPDGDIYPCHQFVGIEEWKMGDIFSDKIDQKIKDYFAGIHIYSKENCGNCWARFYCSGGCNANSFIYEGDVKKPHKLSCELQKKRIECAIALAAAGKDAE